MLDLRVSPNKTVRLWDPTTGEHNVDRIRHEERLYSSLLPLQYNHVPVSIDSFQLSLPCYHNGAKLMYVLLLALAGDAVGLPRTSRDKLTDIANALAQKPFYHC